MLRNASSMVLRSTINASKRSSDGSKRTIDGAKQQLDGANRSAIGAPGHHPSCKTNRRSVWAQKRWSSMLPFDPSTLCFTQRL
jgi:hypothetical protein